MEQPAAYVIYLDDYHAGDVHFLQSLARGLARRAQRPAPAIVHGSGEHAERLLEANGIFRRREHGVLQIESREEHTLVERATRQLNQKLVAILSDAVVSSVGVFGTQRRALVVRGSTVEATSAPWMMQIMEQGIVPVLAAYGRDEQAGTVGEVPIADAVVALAQAIERHVEVVVFTVTNLPGIMAEGHPVPSVEHGHPGIEKAVSKDVDLDRLRDVGLTILLTNTTRFADSSGPVGTRVAATRE